MNNHTNAEAVEPTPIDHSTSYSLPERDNNTVSERLKDLIVVYVKRLLPLNTLIQIT